MPDSQYDELHDRFFSILNSKKGTRYERLAAVVFKALHEQHVVIHDFRLRGDSKVKHQIDVLIEVRGMQKRVLIECKDFDKSGKKVGLGILRDFRSVVEDTKADEAFVLTCTAYTQHAMKYAKAKGIKLAVLRAFEDKDWEGRIKQVIVNLHFQAPPRLERTEIELATAERKSFVDEAAAEGVSSSPITGESPVYLVSDTEQVQVLEFFDREANKLAPPASPTLREINLDPAVWRIRIAENAPRVFTRFKFVFRAVPILTHRLEISTNRVAELILKGFGDDDIIIFADQLQRAKIDSEGHVTCKPVPSA
jgi:Restriction endonuclease